MTDTTLCIWLVSVVILLASALLYWRAVQARREAKAFLNETFRLLLAELKAPHGGVEAVGKPVGGEHAAEGDR